MEEKELEKIVKQKSNNRCVMCHKNADECYALEDSKELTEDNLISLCYLCAQQYLGNPDIIKQIKQIRDYWYEQVVRAIDATGNIDILLETNEHQDKIENYVTAIYHVVYEHENFLDAAKTIHELLYCAQEKSKGYKRILYLDIDGHLDEYGRFDNDMTELQQEFLIKTLLPYFYEIHMPMLDIRNPESQNDEIPKEMEFIENKEELKKYIEKEIKEGGYIIQKLQKEYTKNNKKAIYIKKQT